MSMVIVEVELRQPHHYAGQMRHAYRVRDGFSIQIEGSMVSVFSPASGRGVMFPTSDVLTARTEPGIPGKIPADAVMTSDDEITEPAPPGHPGHRAPPIIPPPLPVPKKPAPGPVRKP